MTPRVPPIHRVMALAWLAVVAALALHQYRFWQSPAFTTDVVELLPQQSDPALEQATARLLAAAATQWVVLVGAEGWDKARRAAEASIAVLDPDRQKLQQPADGESLPASLQAYLASARGTLLTRESRRWLQTVPDAEIAQRGMQNLLQPFGDGFSSWRDDPLGLWGEWLRERAQWSHLRPRDGWLWVEDAGIQWIALPFVERDSAFATWSDGTRSRLLDTTRQRVAKLGGDIRLIAAGTPLQAEAAAKRARFEVSVIGTGSLLAVILLTLVTFGSLRPILLVTLSLTIGCVAALSATHLLFGDVHLMTMIFGASLVGVAEDYGIHYFAARQGHPLDSRWEQLRQISPGLWLALATSGIAYLALGLAPFPGLRQIAVFSCVGLVAAFLTVLCWFPFLDRKPLKMTAFAEVFARTLDRWPRWPGGWKGLLAGLVALALLATGLLQLRSVDDVRLLQNVPHAMLDEQLQAGRILGLASPAQVFLVSGDTEQSLLINQERLTDRLAPLVRQGVISGFQALSDWVPSQSRQETDGPLIAKADSLALRAMAAATGERIVPQPTVSQSLTIDEFMRAGGTHLPVGAWQDDSGLHFSLVMLQGVSRASLPLLADSATGLQGIRWIDSTAQYSEVLTRYRARLSGLLVLGAIAVMLLLHWRYKARAWRAYLPTLVGGVLTLACFGWAGVPLQLFVVLALILLLGMGIDYGIFMLEHPGERSVWLAVAIAGVSTLLAFGLLALSSTPALHAFGLAMLIGETSIWLLTPVFRAESSQK
ncbi:MAG: hypothetical protein ABI645_06190 [Pseudomonadota bacterium]